jgi:hypothetical protein
LQEERLHLGPLSVMVVTGGFEVLVDVQRWIFWRAAVWGWK